MSRKPSQADKRAASILHEIYRPVLRGYFAAFALYYIAMFPTHLYHYSGLDRVQMGSLALIAATIGLIGAWALRKQIAPERSSAVLLAMNISVVCNVFAALNIDLQPEKLTYFIIMVMAFGLASINLRQSVLSIVLALAAMAYFLPALEETTYTRFTFLGFAAALAAAKVRGTKLGNPNGAAALRRAGKGNEASVEAIKQNADRFAEGLRGFVEDIRESGVTSLAGIAGELNARHMRTARDGRWHASSVRNLLGRLGV
ncbi:hypothetical protein [Altererythrobacter sp. GH1-8]|uniref:hypothetical protein n=1 Tax=Altererythrobacter sp. GH1-8 TaxID=3349333 RepID=UPI00374CF341